MSEYALAVFGICLVVGICLTISYGQGKAQSLALGIITLWVILSPLGDMIKHFDPNSFGQSIDVPEFSDGEIDVVIEDAFADGICLAIADKFSLDRDEIRVRLYGFEKSKMCAEEIMVILSGRAALSDYKAVEKYINAMEVGECRVEIEIGGRDP